MRLFILLIAVVACILLAQDAPRGFRNPADVVMMTSRVVSGTGSTLTNGLLAFWNFSDPLTNDAHSTNYLTLTGVYGDTNGIVGKGSLHTNGVANYWSIANARLGNLAMEHTNRFSLSCWVYYNGSPSDYGIVVRLNNTAPETYGFYGSSCKFLWSTNGGLASNNVSVSIRSEWMYNLIGVYSGDALTIYTNGVQAVTEPMGGENAYDGNDPLTIASWGSATRTMSGMIDEIGIWERALTSNEIYTIYNVGTNGTSYPWTGY